MLNRDMDTAESLQTNLDDICQVFHIHQRKLVSSYFAPLDLFSEQCLLTHTLESFSSLTCRDVPINRASKIPNRIPAQSGHNTCNKRKNRQLHTLLSFSFTIYIHLKPVL